MSTLTLDFAQTLNITHTVISWLREHAIDLVNVGQVGHDGNTIFERVQGKRFNGDLLRVANQAMMRVAGKVQGGVMSERWFEGSYMGMRFHTK